MKRKKSKIIQISSPGIVKYFISVELEGIFRSIFIKKEREFFESDRLKMRNYVYPLIALLIVIYLSVSILKKY